MVYTDFIERILKEATDIAKKKFGQTSSSIKPDDANQVLTDADLAIGKKLIEKIEKTFPSHSIIDEERGGLDKHSQYTWVIDPIDGTSNYAKELPHYGIMVGLLHNSQPFAGGISLPYFNEIYLAEKTFGAYCNGKKIVATKETDLLKTLLAYSIDSQRSHPEITLKEGSLIAQLVLGIQNLRNSGSAYDFCMVAKGIYGGYVTQTSKIWDNVAPQIVMEEAGCIYSDLLGKPIDYSNALKRLHDNYTFCTAPEKLHAKLQSIIHETYY